MPLSAFRDPLAASDPLAGIDLAQLPAAPTAGQVPAGTFRGTNPLGASSFGSPGGFGPAAAMGPTGVSNPMGGPTDAMMRIVCGAMLAGGIVLIGGSLAMFAATGSFYIAVVALAPLALILGVAGLISPNVIRAVGKYGGHLSWHYKAIGYGVLGLYFVILILLLAGLLFSGFEPDRPGRPRGESRQSNAFLARMESQSATPHGGLFSVANHSFLIAD
jgi:hypothetical protein